MLVAAALVALGKVPAQQQRCEVMISADGYRHSCTAKAVTRRMAGAVTIAAQTSWQDPMRCDVTLVGLESRPDLPTLSCGRPHATGTVPAKCKCAMQIFHDITPRPVLKPEGPTLRVDTSWEISGPFAVGFVGALPLKTRIYLGPVCCVGSCWGGAGVGLTEWYAGQRSPRTPVMLSRRHSRDAAHSPTASGAAFCKVRGQPAMAPALPTCKL